MAKLSSIVLWEQEIYFALFKEVATNYEAFDIGSTILHYTVYSLQPTLISTAQYCTNVYPHSAPNSAPSTRFINENFLRLSAQPL
jgi:hypothetical protein